MGCYSFRDDLECGCILIEKPSATSIAYTGHKSIAEWLKVYYVWRFGSHGVVFKYEAARDVNRLFISPRDLALG